VRFARKSSPEAPWQFNTADQAGDTTGVDLAFDLNGNPAISHGWGKLRFVQSFDGGTSWQVQILESKNAYNDVLSLVYDPSGYPSIAYYQSGGGGGLKLARWNGASWVRQVVHPGAGARYKSLAYDADRHPAIAYSDDIDGDGWLDTLRFAHWNGSSWEIEVVETGVIGYGVFASLAFDPLTGFPTIAHANNGEVRFVRWTGTAWQLEIVASGSYCSLAYDSSGAPTISYSAGEQQWWAWRDSNGLWQPEIVDRDAGSHSITDLKFDPTGNPSVSYWTGTLRFARREP
jgi:hypothetical protein